jgi:hypothetical protein
MNMNSYSILASFIFSDNYYFLNEIVILYTKFALIMNFSLYDTVFVVGSQLFACKEQAR